MIKKLINKIRLKIVRFLLGDQYVQCIIKINENSEQINFLSSIISEQSRVLASLALVQSDIAQSMSQIENVQPDKDYLVIKIPVLSDEFLN